MKVLGRGEIPARWSQGFRIGAGSGVDVVWCVSHSGQWLTEAVPCLLHPNTGLENDSFWQE